ncbi:MAG: glutamine--fructose-6-phosphate transaminase (isomerizing) [Rhodospirillaceae bacterium]|nr:glutamine--fructose-6-phosphate transaminase (isomerizing) [Rhodospirillaceae bacterium]|tara:strand:+ start:11964 stop:13787 length:1824 start_codon:yes stop_codon:yes gene_type:complete
MCGIIGVIGDDDASQVLVDGLRRLEYRGYDSAGIATLVGGAVDRRRAPGKLNNLDETLRSEPLPGAIGIGHTRWATHGVPNETNAHPHIAGRVAVVHNGIIENFRSIKNELGEQGARFASDTDTEVVAHLLDRLLDQGLTVEKAMVALMERLEGMFALGFLIGGGEDVIVGARRGAPLAIGWGDGKMYLASDAIALAPYTPQVTYLEEDDFVIVRRDGADIFDGAGRKVSRPVINTNLSGAMIGKGNHRHFMKKEIHEQPTAVAETMARYLDPVFEEVTLPGLDVDFAKVPRVTLIACGTAYYSGLIGKYWLEQVARLPAEADVASEFRYRHAPMPEGGVAVFVSQSGETADTLAALHYARSQGQTIVTITNTETSTMARESDVVLPTHAGPEIAVASTKAFTCQLTVLLSLAIAAAKARGTLSDEELTKATRALASLPSELARALHIEEKMKDVAHGVADARDVLYLGRGTSYVVAMEGALKLKEISYIHAEGYASGEMKHGPIALIDERVPVIVVAPSDELFEKTMSNTQEAAAREGQIILITDQEGADQAGDVAERTIILPRVDPLIAPVTYSVPVQMLAYHAAVRKGTDVDQPRNLAKSVTVE